MNDAEAFVAPRRLYAALTRYVSTCEISVRELECVSTLGQLALSNKEAKRARSQPTDCLSDRNDAYKTLAAVAKGCAAEAT